MNVQQFQSRKSRSSKLSMITCYDAWSARLIEQTNIDSILVGDSCAMVMHGHPSTVHATLEMICQHVQAVRRGASKSFIIGDLPFVQYNLPAMGELIQAGANAVKLEGAHHLQLIREANRCGIPVMGHLGLTPQSVHKFGGHKLQSKSEAEAELLLQNALELQEAGCFALVLECIPSVVAKRVTEALLIPTIGIGAGKHCDGQVLVLQDMLGMDASFAPKFLRTFMSGQQSIIDALQRFHKEVIEGTFPTEEESYQCTLSPTPQAGSAPMDQSDSSPPWELSTKDTAHSLNAH